MNKRSVYTKKKYIDEEELKKAVDNKIAKIAVLRTRKEK